MLMQRTNNNTLVYFELLKDEKYILDEQNIKKDYKDLINKKSNIKNYAKNSL